MGKDQKIPYLNEVILYFLKVGLIWIVLYYLLNLINYYNSSLSFILAIFSAIYLNPFYLIMILLDYIIFNYVIAKGFNEFLTLFLYLLATLFNTLIIIIFVKVFAKARK